MPFTFYGAHNFLADNLESANNDDFSSSLEIVGEL